MKCSILTIGDEILIGQVTDTNSAWIANEMNDQGISVAYILSVADKQEEIVKGLEWLTPTADLIIATGGLGPTKDDITKMALIQFFDDKLVFNPDMHRRILALFEKWGKDPTDQHRLQCYLPSKAIKLPNQLGTAPGLWFSRNDKTYVCLPGVPFEMKGIFNDELIPRILKKFRLTNHIQHRTIMTAGEGESRLSEQINDVYEHLPSHINLAFLPDLGAVRIRLTGIHSNANQLKSEMNFWVEMISQKLNDYIYSFDNGTLESVLGVLCIKKQVVLASAESCTGGYFAHKITSVPGSSEYFTGSIIAYSNTLKQNLLGVNPVTLKEKGAVSEATVIEMLKGLLQRTPANIGVSISGIAGPEGGTPDKPVGTIWLAWGAMDCIKTHCLHLTKNRLENIYYTTTFAMNVLRIFLMKEELT